MTQSNFCTDHSNIDLEVTLKSGESYEGLKCFLLRTYSEQYDSCDAHALINSDEISSIKYKGKRIEPTDYSTFRDSKGRVWQIGSFKVESPPESPQFIFRLKKQS